MCSELGLMKHIKMSFLCCLDLHTDLEFLVRLVVGRGKGKFGVFFFLYSSSNDGTFTKRCELNKREA